MPTWAIVLLATSDGRELKRADIFEPRGIGRCGTGCLNSLDRMLIRELCVDEYTVSRIDAVEFICLNRSFVL